MRSTFPTSSPSKHSANSALADYRRRHKLLQKDQSSGDKVELEEALARVKTLEATIARMRLEQRREERGGGQDLKLSSSQMRMFTSLSDTETASHVVLFSLWTI